MTEFHLDKFRGNNSRTFCHRSQRQAQDSMRQTVAYLLLEILKCDRFQTLRAGPLQPPEELMPDLQQCPFGPTRTVWTHLGSCERAVEDVAARRLSAVSIVAAAALAHGQGARGLGGGGQGRHAA